MINKLNIQRFIEQHSNWEKILSEEPYCLEIKRDNVFGRNLILFKYNMIGSDFSLDIVKECRGLVLDEDTLEVVVFPFTKFFNSHEEYADKIDWSTAKVSEKLDGCVSHDTDILTTDGNIKMSEICKNPSKYTLLTFNHNTSTIEEDVVDGVSIKPNNDDWYEIELDDGRKLNVTGNHRIWCSDIGCYRRVDELNGNEDVMVI